MKNKCPIVCSPLRSLFVAIIFTGLHISANAQLFKCKGTSDRILFQDTPCPSGTTNANPHPKSAALEASVALPDKSNKPGANWSLGPRQELPSQPLQPYTAPAQATPNKAQHIDEAQRQRKHNELERRQAEIKAENDNLVKAENEKVVAFNRMQRCNYARQQLSVVIAGRPIYSYDNKGERRYVEDVNRKATTIAAEQRVAQECN